MIIYTRRNQKLTEEKHWSFSFGFAHKPELKGVILHKKNVGRTIDSNKYGRPYYVHAVVGCVCSHVCCVYMKVCGNICVCVYDHSSVWSRASALWCSSSSAARVYCRPPLGGVPPLSETLEHVRGQGLQRRSGVEQKGQFQLGVNYPFKEANL